MRRTLTEKISQKTWSIEQAGNRVLTSSNGGKVKEKAFADADEAAKHVQKETWSRLKKGFVLHNPQAEAGQPVLHRYIGGGYTGFMPLAPVDGTNTFFCAYTVNQFEKEEVYLMDEHGETKETFKLPGEQLIFEMRYCSAQRVLLMNIDHQIVGLFPDNREVRPYTSKAAVPASALALSGAAAAWADNSDLVVYDLEANTVRYKAKAECELYEGHTPQLCASLSPDGSLLAYCTRSDEIALVDISKGLERKIPKAKKAMTAGMAFSPDGRRLFTQERYGSWSLKCYDLNTLSEVGIDALSDDIKSFAIHPSKELLAVYNYGAIRLFDLRTLKLTLEFKIEHTVKNCALAFTEDYLAVYTDYGCISLYAIE